MTGFDRTENARQMIAASGVPCVHLMEVTAAAGVYCAGFSQHDAGYAMAEHLLQRGYRHIAFAAAHLDPRTCSARRLPALPENAGVYDAKLEILSPEPSSIRLGLRCSKKSCAPARRWTPSSSATMTWPRAACWRPSGWALLCPRKWRLPASTTWRGRPDGAALTTVRTPRAAMGEAGANMLLALMRATPREQLREPGV